MIVDFFQRAWTVCESTECWKTVHHPGVSSSTQDLKRRVEMPSMPVDFFVHTCLKPYMGQTSA